MGRVVEIPVTRAFVPFLQPARYKGAWGGRGSSKSYGFVDLLLDDCMTQKISAICVREHQRSLQQSVKRLIETRIVHHGLKSKFNIKDKLIETPGRDGGGVIVFEGMKDHTSDSIKSYEGFNRGYVEEAQSLSDRSLKLLRPTIRKDGDEENLDSEIWFAWNPDDPKKAVDEFMRGNYSKKKGRRWTPYPNSICRKIGWQDNPYFPKVLETERLYDLRRDPDRYAHVWEGGYDEKSEARVFKRWRVGDLDEFNGLADKYIPRYGGDFGFSNDPTTAAEMYVDTKGKRIFITREAYGFGVEIDQLPEFFRKAIPGMDRWPIVCDSARPETISYLRNHGFRKAESAKKGKGSIVEGVEFLKSYDIIVHPDCIHVIDELTNYKYKLDPDTGEVTPILVDDKNHVIDALRYALEKLRNKLRVGIW